MISKFYENSIQHLKENVNPQLIWFKVFYTAYFFGSSFVTPFYPVILEGFGWSTALIGVLQLTQRLASFFAAPLWGNIADRTRKFKLIAFFSVVCTPIGGLLIVWTGAQKWTVIVFAIILLLQIIGASTTPICDRTIVAILKSGGKNRNNYGYTRLWGAVGWGIGSLFISVISDAFDSNLNVLFYGQAMWFIFVVLALFKLDFQPLYKTLNEKNIEKGDILDNNNDSIEMMNDDNNDEKTDDAIPKVVLKSNSGDLSSLSSSPNPSVWRALLTSDILSFFGVVCIQGLMMGVIATNLFIYLTRELHGSQSLNGASLTFTCIAEVPVFFFSGKLIEKLTPHGVVGLAALCMTVRLGFYAILPFFPSPWFVLPVELLHGVTYGGMWSAAVAYSADIAPPGFETTFQGLVSGAYFGFGSGLGSLIGGICMDEYGGAKTFAVAACINVIVTLSFFAFLAWKRARNSLLIH